MTKVYHQVHTWIPYGRGVKCQTVVTVLFVLSFNNQVVKFAITVPVFLVRNNGS